MINTSISDQLLAKLCAKNPPLIPWLSNELSKMPLKDKEKEEYAHNLLNINPSEICQEESNQQSEALPFTIHRANEAFQPRTPTQWLVNGIIKASSITALVGDPGSGKTYAILDLAICVATGNKWLNKPVQPGPVLWIDVESGKNRMDDRLESIMKGHDLTSESEIPFWYLTSSDKQFDLRKADDIRLLQEAIQKVNATLCIIDALADIMPGADENSVKDVQLLFIPLRQLADKTGCSFLLIHHNNKGGSYRGSTAIAGSVDQLIQVTREGNELRFASKKARDSEPFQFSALLNWRENIFYMSPIEGGKATLETEVNQHEAFIFSYLRENGPTSVPAIQNEGVNEGLKSESVRKAVYSLAGKGLIRRTNPDEKKGKDAFYELRPLQTQG